MRFGFGGSEKPKTSSSDNPKKGSPKFNIGKFSRRTALAATLLTSINADTEKPDVVYDFNSRVVAAEQLKQTGITDERESANSVLSQTLERGFSPFKYSRNSIETSDWESAKQDVGRILKALAMGVVGDHNEANKGEKIKEIQEAMNLDEVSAEHFYNSRMDAFRLYLGLPQEHDTFGISNFRPANSKEDMFYYKINSFLYDFAQTHSLIGASEEKITQFLWRSAQSDMTDYDSEFLNIDKTGVMGRYLLTRGEDERGVYVAYYDKWDLGGSIEGLFDEGVIGKVFEVYDRFYIEDVEALTAEPVVQVLVSE